MSLQIKVLVYFFMLVIAVMTSFRAQHLLEQPWKLNGPFSGEIKAQTSRSKNCLPLVAWYLG